MGYPVDLFMSTLIDLVRIMFLNHSNENLMFPKIKRLLKYSDSLSYIAPIARRSVQ